MGGKGANFTKQELDEEPPKLEEMLDEEDGRYKRLLKMREGDQDETELEEKYYKYGGSSMSYLRM